MEQEEPGLTPSDLKKLMALLKASLTADAKPAAQAAILSDEEGSDGGEDYA